MSGVDIATVKELLGHASLNTTMIYAHLSREHLKTAVDLLDKELFHLKKKNPA
jgi:site-specific recombinase XerD